MKLHFYVYNIKFEPYWSGNMSIKLKVEEWLRTLLTQNGSLLDDNKIIVPTPLEGWNYILKWLFFCSDNFGKSIFSL